MSIFGVDDLWAVRKIVCHRNSADRPCPDGTASAVLLHDALPWAEVAFASHGAEADAVAPEGGLLFCDVTPSRDAARRFVDAGAIVLDHHATARPVVEMFGGRGVFAEHGHQSGATLAYLRAWVPMSDQQTGRRRREPGERVAAGAMATLAAVRDTFDTAHPSWVAACENAEAMAAWEWADFAAVPEPFGAGLHAIRSMMQIGRPLYARRLRTAEATWRGAISATSTRGTGCALVNTLDTSDVERFGDGVVIVGYRYFAEGANAPRVQYSLRSRAYDVGAFALANGGGGHRAAAGFATAMGDGDPVERFLALLDGYESGL